MINLKFIDYVLNNWIAIMALLISIFTYWKNRKSIEVNFEDFVKIDYIDVPCMNKPCKEHKNNFYCNIIKIVNPSSHDIAYFDLAVYDPNNLGNYNSFPYYTKKNIQAQSYDIKYTVYKISGDDFESILNLSNSTYGILHSNSFTIINLPTILPNPLPETICVQFKVSIKSLHKIKHSIARSRYKLYRKTYTLSSDKHTYYADDIKRYPIDSVT